MISINYPSISPSLLKKVCFGGQCSPIEPFDCGTWGGKKKNNPTSCLPILYLKHLQERRLRAPAPWKGILCLHVRRGLSPQGAANPGGMESPLGAALGGWDHSAQPSQPVLLPRCPQPRPGEGSHLPCQQGLPNSPFIIKAAKAAEANRLPPFILNCKINFRG